MPFGYPRFLLTSSGRRARFAAWLLGVLSLGALLLGALLLGTLSLDTLSLADATPADQPPRFDPDAPRPNPITPPKAEEIDRAIGRGIDYLLSIQNPNGSWGSGSNEEGGVSLYAPVPGAHHAFRAAVTSLAVSALIESRDTRDEVRRSIQRAETWMNEHLSKLRRATPGAIYNNWGHAYAISGLVRLHRWHEGNPERQQAIKDLIHKQMELLGRYECIDGGWAYYDFVAKTQRPSGSSISFVTATVLIAMSEAKQIGIEPPAKLVDRAMASIRRQRNPDFSYCYGEYLKYHPRMSINRPGGSLGRSQVCNLAMYLWGDEKTDLAVMRTWLDRLFARNLWLDIGRKRPIPHESWMLVAGYFYYYGHYYAAGCIEQLPLAERPHFQQHLAHILLKLQEKNGCWWDWPIFNYGRVYGTAMATMSLLRCRPGA